MTRTQTRLAVLFADITGSTALFDAVGDNVARQIEREWLAQVAGVLPSFEGRMIKTIGDEVMCVFPDADKAVLAASAMQAAVSSAPPHGYDLKLHMGLHYGDVIEEGNDVFGNTVNVAAYLTAVALPQQIAITDSTFVMLSDALKTIARPIFRTMLKGQAAEATIYQVLWKNDNPELTDSFFSTRTPIFLPGDHGGLVLEYRDQVIRLNHQLPRIVLGRDPGCDLVITDRYASRQHARIELDGMNFYLIDRSINGTYVMFNDRPEISVLRRDVLLDGSGKISLGRAFEESPSEVITFSSDRRSLFRV